MTDVERILNDIDQLNCYDKRRIFEKIGPEVSEYDFDLTIGEILEHYSVESLIESIGKDEVLKEFTKRELISRLRDLFITPDDLKYFIDGLSDSDKDELFDSYDMVRRENEEDKEEEDKESYPDVDGLLEELAQYVVSPDDIIDYLNKIPGDVRKEIIIEAVKRWIA